MLQLNDMELGHKSLLFKCVTFLGNLYDMHICEVVFASREIEGKGEKMEREKCSGLSYCI